MKKLLIILSLLSAAALQGQITVTGGSAGGSGTVTSVDVATANGVSATGGPITTSGSFTFSLGAITPTTVNGNTLTTGTGTLTLGAGKTTTFDHTSTFTTTDAQTYTFPTTSATIARTDAANTFTGTQTVGALVATTLNGNTFTSGTGTLTLGAGKTTTFDHTSTFTTTDAQTYTFPTTSATLARTDAANTFTGVQTMTSPSFTTPVLGTPTSGVMTNVTGTADGLTAGSVTRNHAVYAGASPPTVDVGEFIISVTGVDMKNAATTSVFTVPSGRAFVAARAYFVVTAVTGAGAGTETFKIQESGASAAMTSSTASGSGTPAVTNVYTEDANASAGKFASCAAGNIVQVVVATSQAGSTSVTGTIFVKGFYSQ